MKRLSISAGRNESSGFTLLEVLLAFLVFSLSFATVLQILSGSIRNTVRAKQTTEVALLAQSVMDSVGIDIPLVEGSEAEGVEGDYEWIVEVYRYQGNFGEAGGGMMAEESGIILLKVDMAIAWGEPPRDRVQYFSTVKAMQESAL
jgi:general secretion pathway protein I